MSYDPNESPPSTPEAMLKALEAIPSPQPSGFVEEKPSIYRPQIFVASPKHTGGKGHRYVRFPDGSLRRTDKVLRKALVSLPLDQQTALIQAAMEKLEIADKAAA